MKAIALRTETLEAAALHAGTPAFGAAWLYTAAAEELVQTLTGPAAEPLEQPAALAARLRELEAGCGADGFAPTPAPRPRPPRPRRSPRWRPRSRRCAVSSCSTPRR